MKTILFALLAALPAFAETKARNAQISGAPINALDKGADPTGANDSQSAIQTCATAAAAISGQCVVPVGTYKLNSDVNVTSAAVMVYQGATFTGTGKVKLAVGTPSSIVTIPSDVQVHHLIRPVKPAMQAPTSFPQGNDLMLSTAGSADLHLTINPYDQTSTTNVGGAGSVPITVTDTTQFCPPSAGCSLLIEPYGANEETIASGNWSVTTGTVITATFAKAHTQPYTVRQEGSIVADAKRIVVRPTETSGHNAIIQDKNLNALVTLPNDATVAWPSSGIQISRYLTGGFPDGTNSLRLRMFGATSRFVLLNDTGATELFTVDDSGNTGVAGVLTVTGGVGNGAGFQRQRTAGCATAASLAATCDTTVTWGTTTVNTNYTVVCSGEAITSGVPVQVGIQSKFTDHVVFRTGALTAAAAQFTTIDCVMVHD